MKRPRYEYAVRYRRQGRQYRQVRFFQSRQAAARLVARLVAGDERWLPLVEITVERREVGPWVEVER